MKYIGKILFLSFVFSFFVSAPAHACSPVEGFSYPTVESALSDPLVAIAVLNPKVNASLSSATLILGTEHAGGADLFLKAGGDSCSTRAEDFSTDEYIVVIFKEGETIIEHSDFDAQFSFSFSDKTKAFVKYNELLDIMEEQQRYTITGEDGKGFRYAEGSYIPAGYTLRPGMKNSEAVKKFQTALKEKLSLSDFVVDGSYGPATKAAVEKFQESQGLEIDGLAGKKTQQKLVNLVEIKNSYIPAGYTLRPGMKNSEAVKKFQTALKEKLSLSDFVVDGSYGPATKAAVAGFQRSQDLVDDGVAGIKTQKALLNFDEDIQDKESSVVSESTNENVSSGVSTMTVEDEDKGADVVALSDDQLQLKMIDILKRAKNDIGVFKQKNGSYLQAQEVIIKYNNELLSVNKKSDPLFKSSNGGEYFIYLARNTTGNYLCVDDSTQTSYTELSVLPNFGTDVLRCS